MKGVLWQKEYNGWMKNVTAAENGLTVGTNGFLKRCVTNIPAVNPVLLQNTMWRLKR